MGSLMHRVLGTAFSGGQRTKVVGKFSASHANSRTFELRTSSITNDIRELLPKSHELALGGSK